MVYDLAAIVYDLTAIDNCYGHPSRLDRQLKGAGHGRRNIVATHKV
jgi:hypothetical protein